MFTSKPAKVVSAGAGGNIGSDGLVRALGPVQSIAMVVGTLIGTGIFLVSREMIQEVHTIGWILLAWVVGGFLSMAGALAYAELGTMRPQAGGEYVYLRDGLGPLFGFLFGWGMFWIVRPASVATIGAGFSRAAGFLWPSLDHPLWHGVDGQQLLGGGLIALVTAINYFGVKRGGQVQTAFTALKLGLIVVLTIAAFTVGHGDWSHLRERLPGEIGIGGFAAALVAALWAYDGWNNLTLAGSEIRDPKRTIPRAMIGGIGLVFLFYASINLAYFYILRPVEIAASDNVAAAMAARFFGAHGGSLVALAVMISAFATINSSILSGARVPFAMARDGLFFQKLAVVHPKYRTPYLALILQAAFAIGFSLTGTYRTLYTLTIFAEWLFYTLAVAALFAFRRRGEHAPFSGSGYPLLPSIFIVLATALLVKTFSDNLTASACGLAVILAGTPFYFVWEHRKRAH